MNITYETKLYTTIGEFTSPLSYVETIKKIEEGNGTLLLERFAISNRVIRNDKGEQTMVDANTKITVRLNTEICPILCYEEYEMNDCERKKETDETEEEEPTN
jgi:hypothetical protein